LGLRMLLARAIAATLDPQRRAMWVSVSPRTTR
jgi:hypothetical protein